MPTFNRGSVTFMDGGTIPQNVMAEHTFDCTDVPDALDMANTLMMPKGCTEVRIVVFNEPESLYKKGVVTFRREGIKY